MDFARPAFLWLLLLVPVLAALAGVAARRRRADWRRLAQPGRPPGDGASAWVVAMALGVVALAQPRWGDRPGGPLPPGRDVVLMVDASWSMAAEDVIPNRLGRAIRLGEELTRAIGQDPGDRVAVVAFADRGVIRCPLTTNLGAVVEALRSLRPGGVEPGGTDLGAALETALDAFDAEPRDGGRIVVILSDGEDHVRAWERLIDRARELGVVVHAIALGDAARGHPIPVGPSRGADRPRFTFRGEPVETRRVDGELRGIALATGGAFVPIGLASADLASLYEQHIAPVERQARDVRERPERAERFGLVLLAALAIGLVGSWPWRRSTAERRTPWWTSWLVLIGTATASTGLIGAGAEDDAPRSAAEAIASGRSAFGRGDLDAALALFEQAGRLAPESPLPTYNRAATLYRLARFEEAQALYLAARERADEGLRLKIDYSLGNLAIMIGDPRRALDHYDACLSSTIPGPSYDLVRSFARENRAFAAQQLEAADAPTATEPGDDPADGPGADDREPPAGDRPEEDDPEPDAGPGPDPEAADAAGIAAAPGTGVASGRPSRSTGSPADRLSQALDAIEAARDRRFPELPRVPPDRSDHPNW